MTTTLLAGDIGGTKTILRLVDSEPSDRPRGVPRQTLLHEETHSSHAFPGLLPMVRQFLDSAATRLGAMPEPAAACFGIAGPVVGNAVKVTNLPWSVDGGRMERGLGIGHVHLINDFAAIGHGVLGLEDGDFHTLQEGQPDEEAPIAVIGAGTGLGEGFLVPHPSGYRVFSCEGGHVDFSPQSALEFQLLRYLQEAHDLTHVSVERVVSGRGITNIYEYLRGLEPSRECHQMAETFRTWKQEIGHSRKTVDLAAAISKAAMSGTTAVSGTAVTSVGDSLCRQTMEVFVEAYGGEAGNFALKLLPYGGLYVAGGIAAKILPLLRDGDFLKAFKAKGRMLPLLERVPVHVVLNPKVGLIGAAFRAAELTVSP